MHINTIPMQPDQMPPDESSGAVGINPANHTNKETTFKQFYVHQVDHLNLYFTPTEGEYIDLTTSESAQAAIDQQKRIASLRERQRVSRMNDAYEALKNKIPGAAGKSLTKLQILRQACLHIRALENQLRNPPGPF
ncbi:helix-loop-helix domain-containing protein [Endozoicomonas sp. GU-1]|uniref:basic helix-loop-helix domain-containing protein n=1 Tax=Endozoicomonas sp. GU-1 TaxID=3009078 RepID=UPI0022B5BBE3|nr:helix-loop-helix domain-containing protein [Endozoicomonas sp. GU-1]WBA83296.1 helix-loop-helix domain-containing protein [Endozoicomonas sp. GU-1]WBA86226.1 helix-loop-helix domain-containing protein [Endozoicomonas sp. GU-1]